jgi:peptidoglycan/LPS O-acetylase OafA/YrhL
LAFAVVGSHTEIFNGVKILSGGEAVQLFFIISGFYMALILSKKYHSAKLFYSNRFLRLYPTYALILFGTVLWFLITWVYTHQRPPPFWVASANAKMQLWQWLALQFSNLSMVGLDVPAMFSWKEGHGFLFLYGDTEPTPDGANWAGNFAWIGQAWSIGTEIWFYLLAPFIVRRAVAIQAAVAIASCALMLVMQKMSPLSFFFFPANLWFFLSGSLLFQFYRSRYFSAPKWCGVLALVYVVVACCWVGTVDNPIIRTLILISIALSIPLLFHTFSNASWDTAVGNLSYPVYLVHVLIIDILIATLHVYHLLVVIAVSIVAAILIVRFLENPIDKYRQRRVLAGNGYPGPKQQKPDKRGHLYRDKVQTPTL